MNDSWQRMSAAWVAGASPAGLLYGAIVSATMLAAISVHSDDYDFIALATAWVLVIYWLAHVYTHALSRRYGGDKRGLLRRIGTAASDESSVLIGGLPAIVVYVAAALVGRDAYAVTTALVFSVVLLMAVGYLGAHRVGITGTAMILDVLGAGLFGVAIIIAKSLLH